MINGNGPVFDGASLTDEQKKHVRGLAWAALRKFVLTATGAIASKVVDWVFSDERDEDDGGEDGEVKS